MGVEGWLIAWNFLVKVELEVETSLTKWIEALLPKWVLSMCLLLGVQWIFTIVKLCPHLWISEHFFSSCNVQEHLLGLFLVLALMLIRMPLYCQFAVGSHDLSLLGIPEMCSFISVPVV